MECNYVMYSEDGILSEYVVGVGGVTKILKLELSPEPHCTKFYVEVYVKDKLAYEIHNYLKVSFK